jgi:hypothetical protein
MTLLASPSLSSAFATPSAGDDYFATEAHHLSLGGRLVAALRRGSRFVLIIGDPPPDLLILSRILGTAAAWWYTVIVINCRPELSRDQLLRVPPQPAPSGRSHWGVRVAEPAPSSSPLFIFADADQLSDNQIENVYRSLMHCDGMTPAGVLLARPAFVDRLERSKPRFIKDGLIACFRVHELGREEIETFIRRQQCAGEQASAFTAEAITAIADISGGDPALVNHLARLTLEFAHLASSKAEGKGIDGVDASEAPTVIFGERPSAPEAAAERLPSPPPHRRPLARELLIGLLLCIAIGGILIVPGNGVLSLVHGAEQRLAALRSVDFGAWIKTASDNASPGPAENPSQAAEVIASPIAVEQAMPPRIATASLAATPEHPVGEASDLSSTIVASPLQPTPPSDQPETILTSAPRPIPEPLAVATATTAQPPETRPTLPKATAVSAEPPLSTEEITALVARGDAFVGAGDIATARLFYNRAVEAGDGRAALRMGATFDPAFLDQVSIRGAVGDQREALSWYRRARDLGKAEAERRLQNSQPQ